MFSKKGEAKLIINDGLSQKVLLCIFLKNKKAIIIMEIYNNNNKNIIIIIIIIIIIFITINIIIDISL